MRFLISFFIISLCACGQQPQTKINPEVTRLNNRAAYIATDSGDYEKALVLLDSALKIDSNCLPALGNKLSFQLHLDQIDKALETAKQMQRIKPDAPDFFVTVGVLYEKIGDSISANKYFTDAATHFDKVLQTMGIENKKYDFLLMSKAINLILLGKQQEGNEILKQLNEKEKDEIFKGLITRYMGKSRKEIIENYFGDEQQSSPIEN